MPATEPRPTHRRPSLPRGAARRRRGRPDRDAQDRCRPSTSTTRAAASCSTRSPGCRSTTRPGPRPRSWHAHAAEIAGLARCESLVELGSGTSAKTRLLLRALRAAGTLREFVPVRRRPGRAGRGQRRRWRPSTPACGSRRSSATSSATWARCPGTPGAAADDRVPRLHHRQPRARRRAPRSCARSARALRPGDTFLLGTDLVKDPVRLQRAYDDAAGVTAEFNRNVLRVINRELDADFAVEQFEHVALWDAAPRVDRDAAAVRAWSSRSRSRDLDLTVTFAAGEEMRTEISAKFRPASGSRPSWPPPGWRRCAFWTDPDGDFGLTLAQAPE